MFKTIYLTIASLFLYQGVNATFPPYQTATSNQQLVANQWESISDPTWQEIFVFSLMAPLSVDATQKALSQMTGVPYTTLFTATEIINRQFIRRLYDPLRPIISNPCSSEEEVYDLCSADGIKAWAESSVNRSFLNGNKNAGGFKMSGYEISIGAYKRLSSSWTLGAGGCYAIDHFHYNSGGSGKTNTVLGAIYTLYRPVNYYVLADITFGYGKNDMHRKIRLGEKAYESNSKPNISQVSFYGEAGFDWNCSCILIQPFIGFEADRFKRDCKVEKSALAPLALIYSSKSLTNAFSRVGFHLTIPENCYDLTCAFDFAWQYRLTSAHSNLVVRFADFGTPFEIAGIPSERNSMSMNFIVWSEILEGWTLYLEASGERWKRVSNYNFTGGLIFNW